MLRAHLSKKELISIVDYGTYYPSIDTTYFPGTNSVQYWPSTTNAFDTSSAWGVSFDLGTVGSYHKSFDYYVRCVRVDVIAGDFTDNGDGTVSDGNTGLMWQQGEAGSMNWEGAITYCEALSLAGYNDWRLPNIKELESITEDSLWGPAINTNYFPDAHASFYWSSTTHAYSTQCVERLVHLRPRDPLL